MSTLRLNPALGVATNGLGDALLSALMTTLHLTAPGQGRTAQLNLSCSSAVPEVSTEPLMERDGVRVFAAEPFTLYRLGEASAWCDARLGEGWIDCPADQDPEQFAALVLVPLLGEMALAAGLLLVHAAAVGRRGRGLLLPAASGSGKTTLYGHAAIAGWSVLSDDLVWVHPHEEGARLYGCHRGISPSPTSISRLPLTVIAFPEIAKASAARPLEFEERLNRLVEQAGFSGNRMSSATRFRFLVRVAARTPAFLAETGPSPRENIALLAQLLDA